MHAALAEEKGVSPRTHDHSLGLSPIHMQQRVNSFCTLARQDVRTTYDELVQPHHTPLLALFVLAVTPRPRCRAEKLSGAELCTAFPVQHEWSN
jgi:hypothetical protein